MARNSTNPANTTKGAVVDTQCNASGLTTVSTVAGTLGAVAIHRHRGAAKAKKERAMVIPTGLGVMGRF